ncbi:hypothetical protein BJ912DRAFT_927864 [Pholiota molesta]|nr:hypothetical protein BJ912DRAFT_927864 [Pholiota molesta]
MTGVKLEIPAEEMETAPREEGEAEDGQHSNEDLVYTPYLPERADLPAKKVLEFLDKICAAYGHVDTAVQEVIQDLITALTRSLCSSHGKLLALMRKFFAMPKTPGFAASSSHFVDTGSLGQFQAHIVPGLKFGGLAENTRIDASRLYHSQIEAFFSASSASCGVLLFIRKQIRDQAIQWRWATILPISSQMRHNHPYPDLSYNSLQPFPPSFTTNHIFCHDIGLHCSLHGVGRSINLFAYIVLVDFPWTLAVSQTAASRSAHLSLPYDILDIGNQGNYFNAGMVGFVQLYEPQFNRGQFFND